MNARIIVLLTLAGAAMADAPHGVREYLDTATAVTVTVATESWVFARERADLAVNARDYLSLTPLEVNRSGQREYYWCTYIWSTIDRPDTQPWIATGDEIVLFADARPIALRATARTPREIGIVADPVRRPSRHAVLVLLVADLETIGYTARADELHVERLSNGAAEQIAPWRNGRAALRAFAESVGALVH